MEMGELVGRYRTVRLSFYEWRDSTETVNRIMLAISFACLTGLGAYLKVYTPLSPVPFTAQVFFVLLSGAVLGSAYGGMSQVIYIVLGVVGVPWFAGGASGFEYMAGATGGYLVGFVLAAILVGHLVDKYEQTRTLIGLLPLMIIGVLVIYAVGATWLALVMGLDAWQAVTLGIVPFILVDIIKALIVAGTARLVTTRTPV